MIDPMKWEQMTDEQKLQMCKSIREGVNIRTVTKEDWKLMFEFLLDKTINHNCAFCEIVQG